MIALSEHYWCLLATNSIILKLNILFRSTDKVKVYTFAVKKITASSYSNSKIIVFLALLQCRHWFSFDPNIF